MRICAHENEVEHCVLFYQSTRTNEARPFKKGDVKDICTPAAHHNLSSTHKSAYAKQELFTISTSLAILRMSEV